MREEQLRDLLSIHADGLIEGEDLIARPLAPSEAPDDVEALLHVARQTRATLSPIEPRSEFRDSLRAQLRNAAHQQALHVQAVRKRQMVVAAVGAGGVLMFLGGLLLVGRFLSRTLWSLFGGNKTAVAD